MSQTNVNSNVQKAIPDGYKRTEVGIIPDDWEVKTIAEIANVSSGGTPNRETARFWDGNIPWVTTTLINGEDIKIANEFITKEGLDNSSAKMCSSGTILMAMYGQGKTRGKVGLLAINATINQACAAITLKGNISVKFVLHVLNSMYDEIRDLSNSGGQENLSGGIIKNIILPFPPKEEQTAIANALSDMDGLLSELQNLIAKKQAIKTATMQQLLTGKTRLPAFFTHPDGTPKGTKPSELGKIPEDWEVVILNEVCNFGGGTTPPRSQNDRYFVNGTNNWVKTTDLNNSLISISEEQITDLAISDTGLKKYPVGTVLTAMYGGFNQIGRTGYITQASSINQALVAIKPKPKKLNSYYLLANLNYNVGYWKGVASSSRKDPNITSNDVKAYIIALPRVEEQSIIASILWDMDEEIQTLKQRLAKTRQIKQGMMQELLTGKTRLPIK